VISRLRPARSLSSKGFLLSFLIFTTGCGAGAFLRSGTKMLDEIRATSAEARGIAQDTRQRLSYIGPLALGGALGALFTTIKTVRRLRRR
jgi:hypothetical protein